MSWEIILAPEVHDWFLGLEDLNASLVRDAVELLAERGPALGRRWPTGSPDPACTTLRNCGLARPDGLR